MLFTLALLAGFVLGAALLASSRRTPSSAAWPGWTALVLGAVGVLTLAAGLAGLLDSNLGFLPGVTLPAAGAVFAIGRLLLGDRGWRSWAGGVLASLPLLFWVVFVIAEVVGPAH